MKNLLKKLIYLLLVAAFSFAGAGLVVVPPNARGYLYVGTAKNSVRTLPYELNPGAYWIDPGLQVEIQRSRWVYPDTADFLRLAKAYDVLFDDAVAADELHNPSSQADVNDMARTIEITLRAMPTPFLPTFEFNGVRYFRPDPRNESKYNVEMAHWSRIETTDDGKIMRDAQGRFIPDNRVYINEDSMNGMRVSNDASFLGLLTHEMVHGALSLTVDPGAQGYFDQEQLDQMLTSEVLRIMAHKEVPGAAAAYYEHIRDLALYGANYRARFGDGRLALTYVYGLVMGDQFEQQAATTGNIPVGWTPPEFSFTLPDAGANVLNTLAGNPYSDVNREVNPKTPGIAVTNWVIHNLLWLRQNGVHIRPAQLLLDRVGNNPWVIQALRTVFGPGYASVEIEVPGEVDIVADARQDILGYSYSVEGAEHFRTNNTYFHSVWWRYSYAPLTGMMGNVYWGYPITWISLKTSDLNDMFVGTWEELAQAYEARAYNFPKDVWRTALAPMGMTEVDPLVPGSKCSNRACDFTVQRLRPYGSVGLFPALPLAFLGFLILESLVRRSTARLRRVGHSIP